MGSIVPAITSVGAYLPDYILTNQELETMVNTDDEWITSRTGIKERRILKGEKQGTSVMAVKALEQLLERSDTDPKDLDAVILATITPDYFFPTTANLVATQVGAVNAFGFDMMAACSGFIFALETGANYIRSGNYKKIAIIGADKMSSIINYKDRNSCILFGDGAAGVMLEPNEEGLGIYDAILRSDTVGKELIYLKGGGSVNPPTHETIDAGLHNFFQDGKHVFRYAVKSMAGVAAEIMEKNNLKGEDIAYLVPHQANKRIIDATAKRMGVGPEKVMMNIQYYGNTTAATIPLCLYDYEDKLKKGDNLVLAAFGGGFTWGSMYLKWAY